MERSCARAMDLGLPAIAFTEHLDHTVWTVALDAVDEGDLLATSATPDGLLTPRSSTPPGIRRRSRGAANGFRLFGS